MHANSDFLLFFFFSPCQALLAEGDILLAEGDILLGEPRAGQDMHACVHAMRGRHGEVRVKGREGKGRQETHGSFFAVFFASLVR